MHPLHLIIMYCIYSVSDHDTDLRNRYDDRPIRNPNDLRHNLTKRRGKDEGFDAR